MLLLCDRCGKLYLSDGALRYIYGNSNNVQYRGIGDIYDDWNDSRTDQLKGSYGLLFRLYCLLFANTYFPYRSLAYMGIAFVCISDILFNYKSV